LEVLGVCFNGLYNLWDGTSRILKSNFEILPTKIKIEPIEPQRHEGQQEQRKKIFNNGINPDYFFLSALRVFVVHGFFS